MQLISENITSRLKEIDNNEVEKELEELLSIAKLFEYEKNKDIEILVRVIQKDISIIEAVMQSVFRIECNDEGSKYFNFLLNERKEIYKKYSKE